MIASRRLPLVVGVGAVAVALLCAGCDGSDDLPPPPSASGRVIDHGAWHRDAVQDRCGTGLGTPPEWRDEERRESTCGYGALPFEWHLQWMDHLLGKGAP